MTQPEEQPHVVVHDRRRVDPETGQVRQHPADEDARAETSQADVPAESDAGATGEPETGPEGGGKHAAPEPALADDPSVELKAQLDERTADLQRLTAEYANYRKRVERDRELVITTAKAQVAGELLGVLDDVERAGTHGDLTGAFKAVADKLVGALHGTGLEPFGHEGEEFDPSVHEAVQHGTSPDVSGPTVTAVLRRGYRFGERVLRPALVAVTDHEPAAEQPVVEEAVDKPVEEQQD
ncbi:nucleotide exchange factor GrpE [Saccharothrix sp. 6-C]|uniref:Protein GrpE n=1 Tax=Saccharothrix texasensis TaxID=103734 RepID=A0A3N1HAM1_9PSEU|nr:MULTISPECIES: nucleotide exchange factor GrpE [Saccharothrix]QQQ76311.1 nucleotide exchange factor GrpE [Saccharothrix sp. 6-C]ROP39486.1 molecular chaperone GrpE [Saccharothrix texasensis]